MEEEENRGDGREDEWGDGREDEWGDGREDEWGDGRGKLDHYYLRGGVCWAGGEEV